VQERRKLSPEEWSAQYVTTVLCLFYVYCELLQALANSVLVLDDCLQHKEPYVGVHVD